MASHDNIAVKEAAAGYTPVALPADWRDFVALTKPRVMWLAVFTGMAGMLAAPGHLHPVLAFVAVLCIALGAGAAGALNQYWEAGLDARMRRTANRPLPAGRMEPGEALSFGVTLGFASVLLMGLAINWLAAAILAASILFYLGIYTMWLKPRTPQNIVIGGAAGAFPPLIGWAAVTGDVSMLPVLLFALIFLWTPPHFWALALFMKTDYAAAGIPMLPVVSGQRMTRIQIALYTVPMAIAALAPWLMKLTGAIYGGTALALTAVFAVLALRVALSRTSDPALMKPERQLFAFSIFYLFALFSALIIDRTLGA